MARPNESRERILQAAEEAFAEHGYYPTAMDDIAERAAVAKGTLYYNFSGKAELFEAVVSRGMSHLTGILRDVAESDAPLRTRLSRMIAEQVAMLTQYPKIAAILFRERSPDLDDEVRRRIATIRADYVEFVASLLRDGVAEGVVVDCDTRLAAATLTDSLYSATEYLRETGGDPGAAYEFLTTVLAGGLIRGPEEEES